MYKIVTHILTKAPTSLAMILIEPEAKPSNSGNYLIKLNRKRKYITL